MSLKRKLSEVDDDYSDYDDDACSVTRSEDATLGGSGACLIGGDNRKRRRGQIEKKRRDRINDSLSELKRLVPSAVEKSSSTKLEKAEILQMTVDYLRTVQGGGRDYPAVDHHRVAMDYHAIGFRDCAAEVSRYLMTVEGLDVQDPLRLRLMAHLHACSTRGGGGVAPTASPSWAGYATVGPHQHHQHHHQQQQHQHHYADPKDTAGQGFTGSEGGHQAYGRLGTHLATPTTSSSTSSYTGYTTHYTGFPSIAISPPGSYSPPQGKPYRPWGAEMAY